MMALRYGLLLWYFGVIPKILGEVLVRNSYTYEKSLIIEKYVIGFCASIAVFQCAGFICSYIGLKIFLTGRIFDGIVIVIAIIYALRKGFWLKSKKSIGGLSIHKKPEANLGKKEKKYIITVIGLIAIQIIYVILHQPYTYGVDNIYISMINDMRNNNVINGTIPITGVEYNWRNYKYVCATYYTFLAVVSQTTGIHPLVLCKTILPIVFISLSYSVIYIFGKWIFDDNKEKQYMFAAAVSLIIMFAGYSFENVMKRILIFPWNGKGVLFSIVLPMLFFTCAKGFFEGLNRESVEYIIVLGFAAANTSAMGGMMADIIIIVFSILHSIKDRKLNLLIKGIALCIPGGLFAVIVVMERVLGMKII